MIVIGNTELKEKLDSLEEHLIDIVDRYEDYGDLCSEKKYCSKCPFFKFRVKMEGMSCDEMFTYYKYKHLLEDEEIMECAIQNYDFIADDYCALSYSCELCKLNKIPNCNTFVCVAMKLGVSTEDNDKENSTLEDRVRILEDKINELLKEKPIKVEDLENDESVNIRLKDLRQSDRVEIDLGDGDNINGIVYFIDKKEHEVVLGRSTVCFSKLNTAVGIRLQQEARISFDDIVSIKLDL